MKAANKILTDNNMSSRSAYFAGRGESLSDLNGQILENIYESVKKENGDNAAKSFTNMVADLYFVQRDLSASTFINSFYTLESCSWNYRPMTEEKSRAELMSQTAADELRETGQAGASLFGMMLVLGGHEGKKSDYTRREIGQHFLATHAELLQENNLERLKKDAGERYPKLYGLKI